MSRTRPRSPRQDRGPLYPSSDYYVAVAVHCKRCGKFLLKYWYATDDADDQYRGSAMLPWGARGATGVEAWMRWSPPPAGPEHEAWFYRKSGGMGTRTRHVCGVDGRQRVIDINDSRIRDELMGMWAHLAHEVRRFNW